MASGPDPAPADLAVIGGSGFYRLLDDAVEVTPSTPYGQVSGPITVGWMAGRSVAFIARHGPRHEIAPHRINARANLWALRDLGVTRVIGPCACGSLRPDIGPGDMVVVDQLLDRTWGRTDTFLDGSGPDGSGPDGSGPDGPGPAGPPVVEHVSFADPYCPELRATLIAAANGPGPGAWPSGALHEAGTVVVVQGPRFSTRAESRWYGEAGVDVINMTQYPEAYLARELGLCYAGLALVTDRDVGVAGDPDAAPVTMEAALAVLAANVDHTRRLLAAAIPAVPAERGCACAAGGAPSLRR